MIDTFIARWEPSGAGERGNYQSFLAELCRELEIDPPDPKRPDDSLNAYVFDKAVQVPGRDGTCATNFIDLYKRGCFVAEAKQGANEGAAKAGHGVRGSSAWDQAMVRAKNQAEGYIHALPVSEGRPPFLLVVDIGHSVEVYSEFSRTGGVYIPFPDATCHRILVKDLVDPALRERLRRIWTDPSSLDPALRSARVTRDISVRLAELARSLEASGHAPEEVGGFLMRCIFTMFAEDTGLLPPDSFRSLLRELRANHRAFKTIVEDLWKTMDRGGLCIALKARLLKFNGGFFDERHALSVTPEQIDLLAEASRADWRDVEPAIFGTLLERALDSRERHKLGAHYTPRAYVERLVLPAVVEPLRAEWDAAQAAASACLAAAKPDAALASVRAFHRRLCAVRVLDPACGSGNFLYVTLEHLKRLEAEVLDLLAKLGDPVQDLCLQGHTVHPAQFLGLEVNPRAAALAELCLWIGYLQWHLRTRSVAELPVPVISKFHTIEHRDAVLAYDRAEPLRDAAGGIVTQWNGYTMKVHPVTGKDVPDESARRVVYDYANARPADWPEADFIVGNPPFMGDKVMRQRLGEGYVEALRAAYPDVPDSADFVMFWWHKAARLVRERRAACFGFITTNSLRQIFNRRVLESHLHPPAKDLRHKLALVFAIPDHPWVENADGAAVRIAMTVGAPQRLGTVGTLQTVIGETDATDGSVEVALHARTGRINADLTIGANVAAAVALKANAGISVNGMMLAGSGFTITRERAIELGLGRLPGIERHIREYRNGKDLTDRPRGVMLIDLFGLTEDQVRDQFPTLYQHLLLNVKPERDHNHRPKLKRDWWLFGEARKTLRAALQGLSRYIVTVETSKHRFFSFVDHNIVGDHKLVCIAHDDAYVLGVLSSRFHVAWALAAGSTLEDRPVYPKTRCFEPFPFPDATDEQKEAIRRAAEEIDRHRKRQLALHPKLTLTDMYNVLETLRAGMPLTPEQLAVNEAGLVAVLWHTHYGLDLAVADAYGWDVTIPDSEILERLVALNQDHADSERRGRVRYLRPDFQRAQAEPAQAELDVAAAAPAAQPAPAAEPLPWPDSLAEQMALVRGVIRQSAWQPADGARVLARYFSGVRAPTVQRLVDALAALGQVG